MLTLYGTPKTRSTRVLWALEEAGVDYEFIHVDLTAGEGRASWFLQLNPCGKVPTLVDGELCLFESSAICNYIAEKFPAANLIPEVGTPERARYYQWCAFVISELEQPLWTLAKHSFVFPQQRRVPAIFESAHWEFARQCQILEQALAERNTILESGFSMADILITHTLNWAQSGEIQLAPNLLSYAEQNRKRPAYVRALKQKGVPRAS